MCALQHTYHHHISSVEIPDLFPVCQLSLFRLGKDQYPHTAPAFKHSILCSVFIHHLLRAVAGNQQLCASLRTITQIVALAFKATSLLHSFIRTQKRVSARPSGDQGAITRFCFLERQGNQPLTTFYSNYESRYSMINT